MHISRSPRYTTLPDNPLLGSGRTSRNDGESMSATKVLLVVLVGVTGVSVVSLLALTLAWR